MQKTTNICITKANEAKARLRGLLCHLVRAWNGPILQLLRYTRGVSAVIISELHYTYADVDIPVHAIHDQPREMVLNRLQLAADQPTPQYLNVIVRRPPLVQRQTTEQKVGYLITQIY